MSLQLSPSSSSSSSSTGGVSLNSNLIEASARCYAALAATASQQQHSDIIAAVLQSAANYERARARAAATSTSTAICPSVSGNNNTQMSKKTAVTHQHASSCLRQVQF